MKIGFTPEIDRELKKIKKRNKPLFVSVQKQLRLFSANPFHPSLRIHKLSGKQGESWSLTVTSSIRMIYYVDKNGAIIFCDIGTHDQVYREN